MDNKPNASAAALVIVLVAVPALILFIAFEGSRGEKKQADIKLPGNAFSQTDNGTGDTNSTNTKQTMDQKEYQNVKTLIKQDVVVGTGAEAVPGKTVVVNYTGKFTNGQVFDSSIPRGEPFEFPLGAGKVIAGWDQGVAGMKVGGKRTLIVPPELGYGPNDYGPIPGNSVLIFDVELLGVK